MFGFIGGTVRWLIVYPLCAVIAWTYAKDSVYVRAINNKLTLCWMPHCVEFSVEYTEMQYSLPGDTNDRIF